MYLCYYLTGLLGIILVEECFIMQENDMNRFLVYEESIGRVVTTNIQVQYHVDMIWYCILVLCLCLCYDR